MRIITPPEGLKLNLGVIKNKGSVVGTYLQSSDHVMTCLSAQNIEVLVQPVFRFVLSLVETAN